MDNLIIDNEYAAAAVVEVIIIIVGVVAWFKGHYPRKKKPTKHV